MKIHSDKISEAKDDILGRKRFAAEICKGLTSYSNHNTDGITISITGEWGSGKSTILNFLKKEIESSNDSIKVVEFNPWIFYREASIREAFLIHFALALKDFETTTASISKKIKDFISAFSFLKNISAVAGNAQEGLEKAFEYFSKNDSIPDIKEEIEKELKKSNKKIFIFIDDIDRLSQSEILELMQIISLVMNFSNVHYIIAFDREIVENAIKKEYGNRGFDYLEKIIQVDYSLPAIRKEQLEKIFWDMLLKLSSTFDLKFDEHLIKIFWGYHGLSEYFTTIRDFKRFFNSLSFRLPSIADEININDFLAIEAIRLFDFDGYCNIYNHFSYNLRKRELPDSIFNEDQLKEFRSPTVDLIKGIFTKSTSGYYKKDTNTKRIFDTAYFERYFSLLKNENEISEREFIEFIQRSEHRTKILAHSFKENRIKNLLNRLNDDSISKHFPNLDYGIIEVLMSFFGNNENLFEANSVEITDALINLICTSKNKHEYLKSFFLSFKGVPSPPNIIHIYLFHYFRLFKRENRIFSHRHYEFDEYFKKNYDKISAWYLNDFKNFVHSILYARYTLDCPLIKFLYLINYSELFPDEYLEIHEKITSDTQFVLYILSQFVTLNDENSFLRYDFRYKAVLFPGNKFIELIELLKRLDKSELNRKEKSIIDNLLKIDISKIP